MTTIFSKVSKWFNTIFLQLWLSISSVSFYQRVISSYNGYGVKYVLTLSFVSSLLCSIYILNYIDNIRQYFSYGIISQAVVNLDHILSQFPELKYDGTKISLDQAEPIYINNIYNRPIVAIDPDNKIPASNKAKIPILLTSRKILLAFGDTQKNNANNFQVDYKQLFGNEEQVITQVTTRALLEKFFSSAPKIVTYGVFPFTGLFIFLNTLFEKSLIIVIIYLLANFMSIKFPIKTCIRVVMFASGVFVLLQPITLLIAPIYGNFIWIIQIWANLLMILGILKFTNHKFFKNN